MERGQMNLPSPEFSIESNNSARMISNESFDSGIQSRIQSKISSGTKNEFCKTEFSSVQVKHEATSQKELHEFTYVHSFIMFFKLNVFSEI